jgi:hypothetical protein
VRGDAHLKVPCLAAGMIAGADSIDDMDLLRHGAMPALFGGIRLAATRLDIHHYWPIAGEQQVVRNVLAPYAVDLGPQQEWLGHDAARRTVEVSKRSRASSSRDS